MRTYIGDTFADSYQTALNDVLSNPQYKASPRGMEIREVTNAALVIRDPECCLYENSRRSSQLKYIAAELLWYFSGRNDAEFISRFAKFWQSIKNDDGTVNSAYGNLIFNEDNVHSYNQWKWAYESLYNDKDTRQAIMHFNKPEHQFKDNKDFVCTIYGIFHIRNDELNFTVHMRSNDLILGTPTDIAFFCLLQQQMYRLLKKRYKSLKIGRYTHIVDSLHIYERHFDLVGDMVNSRFDPMTYPELDIDLVDEAGNCNTEVLNLLKNVEAASEFNPDSKIGITSSFIDWLNDRIYE